MRANLDYFCVHENRTSTLDSLQGRCRVIRVGNRPELDDLLEAPNVKATLTALLGENYMVDSDRGSNFTVPGRKANTDWHRDGNDVCPMMAPYIRAAST